MDETICHRCGRQLTIWEATSRSSIVYHPDGHDGYVPHRECGVCFYRHLDREDYGRRNIFKLLYIMFQRFWEPKAG